MSAYDDKIASDPAAWERHCRESEHRRELAEMESSRATLVVIIWIGVIIILGLLCGSVELTI